jgi:formylglycine-generating enzyme required for sulfatase activity
MDQAPATDPLKSLLRSLQEQQGSRLSGLELAEILWLAPGLPSDLSARVSRLTATAPAIARPKPAGQESTQDQSPLRKTPPAGLSADDPLRQSLPSFFPAPPKLQPCERTAGLLPDQVLPSDADLRAVLPIRLQDVRLIADPRPFQAALQPLAAAESAALAPPDHHQLDEVETVDAYARTQRLWPVYSPPRQPRLSLVLLVDRGLSMQVWQRLAHEWLALLMGSTMFRDVRAVALDPKRPMAVLGALAGSAEEQVLLILSDCSGEHWWHAGALQTLLRKLAARCPVAILQVLPDWMWRRTALGIGSMVAVRNRQPFAANRSYQRLPLHRGEPLPPQGDSHLVLPLLSLHATDLDQWSSLVLGRGHSSVTAACLPVRWPGIRISSRKAEADETVEDLARRRLRNYVQRCSGSAERLLRVMAASPVLTLPVMRLLQEAMVKDGGPLAMAELLLSGLIRPQGGGNSDGVNATAALAAVGGNRAADRIQFDFEPGVRSVLLDTLPGPETAEVVQRVSELIEQRWEMCDGVPPFQAFLADPTLLAKDHPLASMAAFATVTADIIARLPGPGFQQLARRLRHGADRAQADPFPPSLFTFEEIEAPCEVLHHLPTAEASDAYSTVQIVDLPLTDEWYETATLINGEILNTKRQARCLWEVLQPAEINQHKDQAARPHGGVFLPMLHLPAGRFLMGSPAEEPGRFDDEGPQHEVQLKEFFLSQTPITQAQWRAVAQWQRREYEDGELWPEALDADPVAKLDDAERFAGEQRPVVNVSWHDAMAFCQRLRLRTGKNYTLPSEAQWEYACRAGTTTPFHCGATISTKLANYDGSDVYGDGEKGDYRQQTTDVFSFPANAWGLHDMHGNVWEWCADHWHDNYEGAPEDGRAWIDEEAKGNKNDMDRRLLRGGSWDNDPRFCRSAYRNDFPPDDRDNPFGFRVCCLPQDLILYP